jgi:hypothetical protein
MRSLVLILLLGSLVPVVQAQSQVNLPGACAVGDAVCVKRWYDEYKPAILNEFDWYRDLEDSVARAISSPHLRAPIVNLMVKEGKYRHRWQLATMTQIVDARIDAMEAIAVFDCRMAIHTMKFAIVSLNMDRLDPDALGRDLSFYVATAKKCEKYFKNKPKGQSQLRSLVAN